MADYHPLISRAVAALEKNNGENRRAIYDRARSALLAQLRGVTPALDESDITRERLALEESIRKVEGESARQFVEASRQMSAAKLRQSRQWDEPSKVRSSEARRGDPAGAAAGRTRQLRAGAGDAARPPAALGGSPRGGRQARGSAREPAPGAGGARLAAPATRQGLLRGPQGPRASPEPHPHGD